jgi:hypothetical protein
LNAAWRVGLLLPEPAPGGGPDWVPDGLLPGGCAGIVTPCSCRHFANAARLALELPLADAAAGLLVVDLALVLALLPQAASTRLAVSAARTTSTRRARRVMVLGNFI